MDRWHLQTALSLLAVGSLVLIAWIISSRPENAWPALAASIQALATVLLVLVTIQYVKRTDRQSRAVRRSAEAAERSAEAMQRSAEASERSVSYMVHEQRVERLTTLQKLEDLAGEYRSRARKRIADTARPAGCVFTEEEIRELEEMMLSVDRGTASAIVEAIAAARRVRNRAKNLRHASRRSSGEEDEAREEFEAANRSAAEAFEVVKKAALRGIEDVREELAVH